jgi:copper chaperone
MMTTEFRVPDATCGHCKQTIEGTVSAIDGVTAAELDLESKTLKIEHTEAVKTDALAGAVSAAGYSPDPRLGE